MWFIDNKANKEAIEATKMAEAVAKQAKGKIINRYLLRLALVGCAFVFLVTYQPEVDNKTQQETPKPPDNIDTPIQKKPKKNIWDRDPTFKPSPLAPKPKR